MTSKEALAALDLVLAEDAQRESAIVRESCDMEKVDPYDAMLISGHFANLTNMAVDEIFMRNGKAHAAVSRRHRPASDPPDVTIYRLEIRERNKDGQDIEVIEFEEVGWVSGASTEWSDE